MNRFCIPTQIILIYCAHLHYCAPLLDYNSQQFQIVNCSNAERIVKFIQNVSSMESLNQKNDLRAAISCTVNSVLDEFVKKDFQLKKCQWMKMQNLEIDSDHLLFCFEEEFVSALKIDFYKKNIWIFEYCLRNEYNNKQIIKKWKRSNNSKIPIRAKRQYFIPNAYDVYSSLGGFDIYDHQAYTVGTMDSLINDLKNVCRYNNPSCDILSTEDILHSAFWTRMPPNIDAGYINDRAAIAITAI
ncbi:hypothetical protein T11_6150 [Trichinella zimbabwensis]|uniref:Uncharacterized protein n=1 Tax=Trichinella zimbabwensis TaxID=268475 RepID=A0A0V1GXJ3_9BILA|nr:hypothetical protein T11_6150 [Trichinella zimbabwensis]